MRGKKRRLVIAVKRPEKKQTGCLLRHKAGINYTKKNGLGVKPADSVICDCGLYKLNRLDKSNVGTKRTRVG